MFNYNSRNDELRPFCQSVMYFVDNIVIIAFFSACGNWIGDTILYPIDTISTRLKASKYINHNPITFTIASIKSDKLKLFRGVQLSFPAAFIPTFVYVSIYDSGMRSIENILNRYKIE